MTAAVPADFWLKLAATVGSVLFAALVLAGGPRKRTNLLLGTFLLLIAGNQAVEAYRALGGPGAQDGWTFRAAALFAVADPLVLYAFAALTPRPNELARPLSWAPLALTAAALVAWALWLPLSPAGGDRWSDPNFVFGELVLGSYTAIAYAIVWGWALRHALADSPAGSRLVYGALCFATLPAAERMGADIAAVIDLWRPLAPTDRLRFAFWVPILGLFIYLAWRRSREPTPAAASVRRWTIAGVLLTIALNVELLGVGLIGLTWDWWEYGFIGRGAAGVRWVLFGVLVSVAVLRHDLLGMTMATRRLAARLVVAALFAAVAAIALTLTSAALGGPPSLTLELSVLLGALLLSQGFRRMVGRVAARLYGVPDRADPVAAADAYRAAVVQSLEGGRGHTQALARLRAELGLDEASAAAIARTAAASVGGPLAAGQVIEGRFQVERFLGRGGAGRTFLATDRLLHRPVVLKEVLVDTPEQEAAVLREARLAAGLQHANVVTLHDVLRRPGAVLLVSEFVDGGSLRERLDAGPLALPEAAQVMDGILAGLEAIHARSIVHRDVKPANVLLTSAGVPKIADFGIAFARAGHTALVGEHSPGAGTSEVMAPEQRRGEPATPATDVYQAGVVLKALAPGAPAAVAAVAARALQASPGRRWPSVSAMRAALRGALPAVSGGRPARSGRRR